MNDLENDHLFIFVIFSTSDIRYNKLQKFYEYNSIHYTKHLEISLALKKKSPTAFFKNIFMSFLVCFFESYQRIAAILSSIE